MVAFNYYNIYPRIIVTNMRVACIQYTYLKNDASDDGFEKQLLEMGNGKLSIDESTQCITLPKNFCKITVMTKDLIDKVY